LKPALLQLAHQGSQAISRTAAHEGAQQIAQPTALIQLIAHTRSFVYLKNFTRFSAGGKMKLTWLSRATA
jgi:hypothetical protein